MRRARDAFFSLRTNTLLVRNGVDAEVGDHTLPVVYREMILQICAAYPGLPDVRTMTLSEIRWFYEGERPMLREHTKPQPKPKAK